jgi:hypothetical protein
MGSQTWLLASGSSPGIWFLLYHSTCSCPTLGNLYTIVMNYAYIRQQQIKDNVHIYIYCVYHALSTSTKTTDT